MTKFEAVIWWSEEDKAFVVEFPELPGCMADGATYEQALSNVKRVIGEWIETAREFKSSPAGPSSLRLAAANWTCGASRRIPPLALCSLPFALCPFHLDRIDLNAILTAELRSSIHSTSQREERRYERSRPSPLGSLAGRSLTPCSGDRAFDKGKTAVTSQTRLSPRASSDRSRHNRWSCQIGGSQD